ncbi:hypothetical protein AC629_08720 [Bradyrhizobium sp. NAS80.1]|nr:hypothetical protein AC629_08720 [Bradyrhizobium sp. NAS80.1]
MQVAEPRASLVAASHEIDFTAFVKGVKQRGDAECSVDTVRDQSIYNEIGNPKSHATRSRLKVIIITPQA